MHRTTHLSKISSGPRRRFFRLFDFHLHVKGIVRVRRASFLSVLANAVAHANVSWGFETLTVSSSLSSLSVTFYTLLTAAAGNEWVGITVPELGDTADGTTALPLILGGTPEPINVIRNTVLIAKKVVPV